MITDTFILNSNYIDGFYVIQTNEFKLEYDGKQFLKFSVYNPNICGLCSLNGSDSQIGILENNYLFYNPARPYCKKLDDSQSKLSFY